MKLVLALATLTVALPLILAACGGEEPEDRQFDLEIRHGSLVQEESVLKVKQGDMVTMVVAADEPVFFHLHGYDIEKEAGPGEPATLEFTANATGNFPFTIHLGEEDHHDGEADDCEPQLPSGAPAPKIRFTASPGREPGEIDVAVQLEDFVLSFEDADTELATGHWHLFVNDELKGMYVQPKVTTAVSSPGEYRLEVGVSDIEHCDYGIDATTTIVVEEGHADGGEEHVESEEELDEEEEISIGSLQVHPR